MNQETENTVLSMIGFCQCTDTGKYRTFFTAVFKSGGFTISKGGELDSESGLMVETRLGMMPKIEAQMLEVMDKGMKHMWNYEVKGKEHG